MTGEIPSVEVQAERVTAMKELIGDDIAQAREVVCWTGEDETHMFKRFLVATQWEPGEAAAQLRKTVEWRMEQGILEMRSCAASQVLGGVKEADVLAAIPMMVKVGLLDKAGRQTSVYHVGRADLAKLNTLVSPDVFQRYLVWRLERLTMVLGARLKANLPERASIVIDFEGFNVVRDFNTQTMNFINTLTSMTSLFFPEMMGKMLFINTSWLFKGVWAVVAPWFRPHSRAKIAVLGRGCQTEMLKFYEETVMSQMEECGSVDVDFAVSQ